MIRIHASYHKCLTMYFFRTANAALNTYAFSQKKQYEHFESIQGLFYNQMSQYYLCSINSFAPDIEKIDARNQIRQRRNLFLKLLFF